MDIMHKITKWIDHNRYVFTAMVLIIAIVASMVWLGGCQSKTASLVNPEQQVTRQELHREAVAGQAGFESRRAALDADIAAYNADYQAFAATQEAAVADLDRQDAIKAEILTKIGALAQSSINGDIDIGNLIGLGVGVGGALIAGGTLADNKRKDSVIAARKG